MTCQEWWHGGRSGQTAFPSPREGSKATPCPGETFGLGILVTAIPTSTLLANFPVPPFSEVHGKTALSQIFWD